MLLIVPQVSVMIDRCEIKRRLLTDWWELHDCVTTRSRLVAKSTVSRLSRRCWCLGHTSVFCVCQHSCLCHTWR